MNGIYINLDMHFEDMNITCICIYDRKRRDEEKACYGKLLGCFYDEGPFDYLDMLPSPPELVSIDIMNIFQITTFTDYNKNSAHTRSFSSINLF